MDKTKTSAKILIVDDVDTNRFILRDIINQMGYMPLLAEDGEQAIKIVERLWPQLIISDIAMPKMDGYELCEKLKQDPKTRDIPIIFISAFDDASDIVKGFEIGGEDYITKPFLPEVVQARVGLHLKLADAKHQLAESNRLLQSTIEEKRRQIDLERKNVLYALTRVARENAAYDVDRMERLNYNCRMLAEALQLTTKYTSVISDSFIDIIGLATPICDIGNIAISGEILQKKDPLNDADIQHIKKHTQAGARILKDIKESSYGNAFIEMSYDIVLYHHEHWDGSGYPNHIKGNDIPLSAQIVAVVSEFCAMTEQRVYREPYSVEETIAIMDKYSGTRYNPEIYNVLKMIVKQLK